MPPASPLEEPSRAVPLSTTLSVLTAGQHLLFAVVALGLGASQCGAEFGTTSLRTRFLPTRDVPATFVGTPQTIRTGLGKGSHTVYRFDAKYVWEGRERIAQGHARRYPASRVLEVRVPVLWPSLAFAFSGGSPEENWGWTVWWGFAVVGLGLLGHGLRLNVRTLQLLRMGRLTTGSIVAQQERPGGKAGPQFELTFTYRTHLGASRTTITVPRSVKDRVSNGQEPMLYDPSDVSRAVILDALPETIRVSNDGQVTRAPWGPALRRLGLVACGVGAVAWGLDAARLLG